MVCGLESAKANHERKWAMVEQWSSASLGESALQDAVHIVHRPQESAVVPWHRLTRKEDGFDYCEQSDNSEDYAAVYAP